MQYSPTASSRGQRRILRPVVVGTACLAAYWQLAGQNLFATPRQAPELTRRGIVSAGLLGSVVGMSEASQAAEVPFLGKIPGPFEMDPKKAVIVGDPESEEAQKAKAKVIEMRKTVEKALSELEADPQADLSYVSDPTFIGDSRLAINAITDLMDEKTQGGTNRWQRLMNQAIYLWQDDTPFPENRKGEKKPRGVKRNERITKAFKDFIYDSNELLKFLEV